MRKTAAELCIVDSAEFGLRISQEMIQAGLSPLQAEACPTRTVQSFRVMRYIAAIALFSISLPLPCLAQQSNGYVFVGATNPGSNPFTLYQSTFAHLGGGGETDLGKWFGFGAEIGALLASDHQAGLASLGPYLHFLTSESRVDPFVTTGYTMLIRGGLGHLWHAGGGVNYWLKDRIGLRAEFRDHVWPQRNSLQFLDFRFGVVFR